MPSIYILKCEDNRYYVGKTDRPLQIRILEHFRQQGSEWTKMYKPIQVVDTRDNCDGYDEDKYTKTYMMKYGIDNVRGGSYTQIELPDYKIKSLQDEFCTTSDLCFRCHRGGHFASKCFAKTMADGSSISNDYKNSTDDYVTEKQISEKTEEALHSLVSSIELFTPISSIFQSVHLRSIDRLCPDTIKGCELRQPEYDMIKKQIGADVNESIEIIYRCPGIFEKPYDVSKGTHVGITTKRIFRISGSSYSTLLSDIVSFYHKSSNIFRWDSLVVKTIDDKETDYLIYYSATVRYFIEYLDSHIKH